MARAGAHASSHGGGGSRFESKQGRMGGDNGSNELTRTLLPPPRHSRPSAVHRVLSLSLSPCFMPVSPALLLRSVSFPATPISRKSSVLFLLYHHHCHHHHPTIPSPPPSPLPHHQRHQHHLHSVSSQILSAIFVSSLPSVFPSPPLAPSFSLCPVLSLFLASGPV